jgi:phosphate transport system permease protein
MIPGGDRSLEYYLLPYEGGRPGAPFGPMASIEEVLARLARWSPESAPAMDIVAVRPGESPAATRARVPRRPRYRFVLSGAAAGGGEGTELSPWLGVPAAVEQLAEGFRSGRLSLAAGERLHFSYREVFTATPLESRKRLKEAAVRCLLAAVTLSLVLPVLLILTVLVAKAWPALSWGFLVENPKNNMTAGGIWAPLVGTFFLVLTSLAAAAPVGILAGIYLNEYARDNWLTRIVNLAVMNLAGVPSIVHGLFGVGAFVLFFHMGRSILAASCTLAVMTLPVIITSTREALASVPMAFREACWNLGASRWQTIRTIVLPNSTSGILTGVILQVARAAGETAPILFTGAVYYVWVADHGWASLVPYGLTDRCMALSMHLFTLATQVQGVPESVEYATAVVLIGLVLAVNSLSIALRIYLRVRKRW